MFSSQSIDFSCYVKGEVAEWLLDSGCTKHVTPGWSCLHNYKESNPPGKAEITDRKFITIKGQGTVIGYSLLPDNTKFSMDIRRVLYVPEVSKQLFLLIATGQMDNKSETMRWGTIVSQNGTPFIIGEPHGNKFHYFNLELVRSINEIPNAVITTLSCDYTLWHRRMGHTPACDCRTQQSHITPNLSMWRLWERKVQETSISQLKVKGTKTLRLSSFWSGWISNSLHWQFQTDSNLPWRSLILWSNVLFKE